MNLIFDIGNSRTKVALFENNELVSKQIVDHLSADFLTNFLKNQKITHSIIASVGNSSLKLFNELQKNTFLHNFSYKSILPFTNLYASPQTLGVDRMAAISGAMKLLPSTNILVIDAGSCITFDFVQANGEYHGGAISPGLSMRFKSLNTFTASLPLVTPDENYTFPNGIDTKTSILAGVQDGIKAEIISKIEHYLKLYPDLSVLICGGDSAFFDSQLKNSIFANLLKTVPDLVLYGLNSILQLQNGYSAS